MNNLKDRSKKVELFNPDRNWVSGHRTYKAFHKKSSKDLCEEYLNREQS